MSYSYLRGKLFYPPKWIARAGVCSGHGCGVEYMRNLVVNGSSLLFLSSNDFPFDGGMPLKF